uniref:Fucosyltransferase n=2 Tax=Ixodes ricinus TaxID=34613 RepID=A0A131XTT6_IXORI
MVHSFPVIMVTRKFAIKFIFAAVLICACFVILYVAPRLLTKPSPRGGLGLNLTPKYVLTWTPFFGDVDYIPSGQLESTKCGGISIPPCVVTSNRSLLNESDLVIFHMRDIRADDLPAERPPGQRWALLDYEAPPHTPRVPDVLKGTFNWTITYRQDSDVNVLPQLRRADAPDQMAKPFNWWTDKTRHVLWLVSNCKTPSNREGFVQELRKFIQVDVVGQCGHLSCLPKMSADCYHNASKIYFFYLALENSICTDYITEKFYNALTWGMVPIVMSGANYTSVAPPGSYIDALSFQNVRHLADHLKQIAKDPLLYNSYHAWRQRYKIVWRPFQCNLCQMLHEQSPPRMYEDINAWWFMKASCKRWMKTSQH